MALRRLPGISSQGPLQYEDLAPKHRQAWEDLPRHSQDEMEPSTSDQVGAVESPGADELSQSSRSTEHGLRGAVQGGQEQVRGVSQGVDSQVRQAVRGQMKA